MREAEYERLAKLFEKEGRYVTKPQRSYATMLPELPTNENEIKGFLLLKKQRAKKQPETTYSIEEQYASVIKSITKTFKQFYTNYLNVVSQQKKIATLCSREVKRSLSKTSKTNPTLKSKRINRELSNSIKKTTREEVFKQKKEVKEEEQKRRREEEEKEELRQKRKFNYLMSQTEAFASFFLDKRRKVGDEEENKEAMKAIQSQMEYLKDFDEERKTEKDRTEYEYQQVQQPTILKAQLKEHQIKGLNWLVNLYNQGINGILADDMGLGKTVQSISLLCHLYEVENVHGPFLIVTPSSTLHNWADELARFVPLFSVLNYWGSVHERKAMRKSLRKCNVVVTSYQIAVSDETIISKIKWQYMILDEAQAIKSINSQRWRVLLGFKSRNRLLLTGTPIQNSMQELWSLLHFIMPTLFDSLSEFSEWFSKDIESKGKIEDEQINKLHTILKPFMLRRHKSDIKDEIGSKEIINVSCTMSNRQKALYNEIVGSKLDYENIMMQLKKVCNHPDLFEKLEPFSAFAVTAPGENGFVGHQSYFKKYIPVDCLRHTERMSEIVANLGRLDQERTIARSATARLFRGLMDDLDDRELIIQDIVDRRRQIENRMRRFRIINDKVSDRQMTTNMDSDVELVSESRIDALVTVPPLNTFISESGKLSKIDSLLWTLKEERHRVLIYFQMTKMMDLFEEYLVKREFTYLRLDGSSKISQRKELVRQWQRNEEIFIFILSTRAGGVGINLTAADTVIFYDSDWNPTVDQQAMDRVHRLGQTKDVTVYRLITENSVEEKVLERANQKEKVQQIVIKGNVFEGTYLD